MGQTLVGGGTSVEHKDYDRVVMLNLLVQATLTARALNYELTDSVATEARMGCLQIMEEWGYQFNIVPNTMETPQA